VTRRFFLSALVDFVDDASEAVYSPEGIFSLVAFLKNMGVSRLYWIHYGDENNEFLWKKGVARFSKCYETIKKVGQPISVAAKAAIQNGMELIALIKPYENGISMVCPMGSPEAEELGGLPHLGGKIPYMMRFVREHPEMRIKRRMDDIPPNVESIPVCLLKLYKSDDLPTRIRQEDIQIWVSDRNYQYQRADIDFDLADEVAPAPHDFIGFDGNVIAKKSAPVRVLTLKGINLTDPCIIITTGLGNDSQNNPSFTNSAVDMVAAFGPDGREIPISVGRDSNIWSGTAGGEQSCFEQGVSFDDGFGRCSVTLNTPNQAGFIAFVRGKNEYLPTALCEAYPQVRDFWIHMVEECLEAGVDGVDFRIENHSTHTDDPFSYGFNAPVLDKYKNKYGSCPSHQKADLEKMAEIRGGYYTTFLQEAKRRIANAGKKCHVHMNAEFLRPDPPISRCLAYPWNIRFDWLEWLRAGIMDEATLRTFSFTPDFVLADLFSNTLISRCRDQGIPLNYTRYIQPSEQYVHDLEKVFLDGRFQSFIIYETANFLKFDEHDGIIVKKPDLVQAIRSKATELGII
jgi:hypothetical protein